MVPPVEADMLETKFCKVQRRYGIHVPGKYLSILLEKRLQPKEALIRILMEYRWPPPTYGLASTQGMINVCKNDVYCQIIFKTSCGQIFGFSVNHRLLDAYIDYFNLQISKLRSSARSFI
jgi:hypothetical protein